MPVGQRFSGIASGPAAMPRTLQPTASQRQSGLVFAATAYDSQSANSEQADSTGQARVTFGPVPLDLIWRIERINVSTNSNQQTLASVYLGEIDPRNLIDRTPSGNSDVADNINPILVSSGQMLIVAWESMAPGDVGTARLQIVSGSLLHAPLGGGDGL